MTTRSSFFLSLLPNPLISTLPSPHPPPSPSEISIYKRRTADVLHEFHRGVRENWFILFQYGRPRGRFQVDRKCRSLSGSFLPCCDRSFAGWMAFWPNRVGIKYYLVG